MLEFKENIGDQIKHLVEYTKSQMPSGVSVKWFKGGILLRATIFHFDSRVTDHWVYEIPVVELERRMVDDDRAWLYYFEVMVEETRDKLKEMLK